MKVVLYGPKNPETLRFLWQLNRYEGRLGLPVTKLVGFLHSDPSLKGTNFEGYPIFGSYEEVPALAADGVKFVSLVTGSTVARYRTTRNIIRSGGELTSLVHPDVELFCSTIGEGAYIQEKVVIQANVHFGNNCSVHIGCLVAHDITVGHSAFVSFGVALAGEVQIGDGAFIGANATVLPGVKVGKFSTVGAGSVVTRHVPDYAIMVGNPARIVGENPRELSHGDVFTAES